jgi:hypothetical protein
MSGKSLLHQLVPEWAKKLLRILRAEYTDFLIARRWIQDCAALPLTAAHKQLYFIIQRLCRRELGRLANLQNCEDFNDRIQWLNLYDQSEEHIRCSDKITVRDYVRERVGDCYLTKLYQTCQSFDEIDFGRLPSSFVIKVNHDSGSVILVRNKNSFDRVATREKIVKALSQPFGWDYGEWAYDFVKPRILVEEFIEPESPAPPPDFKFYVVNGVVRFVHFISERGANTKEQIVSPSGEDMATSLYPAFQLGDSFRKPACWEEMKQIAERLGNGFKCVRVDLFESAGRIFAGELTFWPMAGCYKGDGQKRLGPLLDFDRTTFKPLVYNKSLDK